MRENDPHVGGSDGDATRRGIAFGRAQVKEDGAAAALPPRPLIVIEQDNDVIEMVVAPKLLMGDRIGQAHGPVVVAVADLIAPAVATADPDEGKRRLRRLRAVAAEEHAAQAQVAQRRGAIALALLGGNPAPPEEAGKDQSAHRQPAMPAGRRDRANVKSCDDFPHGELSCEGSCRPAW